MEKKGTKVDETKEAKTGVNTVLGGVAKFNDTCRTEKCVYNVSRTCKCRDINGKFCIGYTANIYVYAIKNT